ncbi:hypothetical protein OSTOST_23055, partial [Ostertagia ostertagi]
VLSTGYVGFDEGTISSDARGLLDSTRRRLENGTVRTLPRTLKIRRQRLTMATAFVCELNTLKKEMSITIDMRLYMETALFLLAANIHQNLRASAGVLWNEQRSNMAGEDLQHCFCHFGKVPECIKAIH